MRRNTLNFLIDFLTALVLLGMVATGLLLKFVLPPGSGGRRLWSLGRHDWGDIHFWLSAAIAALLIVHLALHWQWVCATLARFVRREEVSQPHASPWKRNLAGAAFLLILAGGLGAFVWAAQGSVSHPASGGGGGPAALREALRHDEEDNQGIRGSMTLAEVAAKSCISLDVLRRELGLPASTPADEKLGRLSRRYNFSMQKVREVAAAKKSCDACQ